MADQPSIFENKENSQVTPEPTDNQQPASNPLEDLLKEIKREDGSQKYSTVEEALKGQVHAQKTIAELKAEKERKDAELAEKIRLEQELEALRDAVAQLTQKKEEPTGSKPISEEDIKNQVSKAMQEVRSKEVAETNIKTVLTTLTEKFGDKAETEFYSKGKEAGFTAEEMNALAASKPKAVFSLLGITETGAHQQPLVSPTTSSLNTAGMKPKTTTFIRRNDKRLPVGSTFNDVKEQIDLAHNMTLEAQERGISVRDMSDPKVFNQIFK